MKVENVYSHERNIALERHWRGHDIKWQVFVNFHFNGIEHDICLFGCVCMCVYVRMSTLMPKQSNHDFLVPSGPLKHVFELVTLIWYFKIISQMFKWGVLIVTKFGIILFFFTRKYILFGMSIRRQIYVFFAVNVFSSRKYTIFGL